MNTEETNNLYTIQDNGGTPLQVRVDDKFNFSVYALPNYGRAKASSEPILLLREKAIALFVPESEFLDALNFRGRRVPTNNDIFRGNTILAEIPVQGPLPPTGERFRYLWVGNGSGEGKIIEFWSRDKILKYRSPVGNSNVPYAFATTVAGFILLPDVVFLPLQATLNTDDPYASFYGRNRNSIINAELTSEIIYSGVNESFLAIERQTGAKTRVTEKQKEPSKLWTVVVRTTPDPNVPVSPSYVSFDSLPCEMQFHAAEAKDAPHGFLYDHHGLTIYRDGGGVTFIPKDRVLSVNAVPRKGEDQ